MENNNLKIETPEERETRLAKAREARLKREVEKKVLTEELQKQLKAKWQVPIWGWFYEEDENGKKTGKKSWEIIGFEKKSGKTASVDRLMHEMIDKESKNVVPAFKLVAELTGEYKEESANNTIVVQFNNKDIDI